jgi:hypothetical protein
MNAQAEFKGCAVESTSNRKRQLTDAQSRLPEQSALMQLISHKK